MFASPLRASDVFIACLLIAPLVIPSLYGHDWQRLDQVIIAFVALLVLGWKALSQNAVGSLSSSTTRYVMVAVLFLGGMSSLISHQPHWALAETSLLLVCCCIANHVADARCVRGTALDRALLVFIVAVCLIKTIQFVVSSVAAFSSGAPVLNMDLLLEGFSNKRFYGQFQTFTLPFLAAPLLLNRLKCSIRFWLFLLLSSWWMIAISGGTRGTWLGMACAMGVVFLSCGRWGRRWAVLQTAAAALGVLLFWLFFNRLPALLGIEVLNFAGDRLNASLSARDILWHQAWDMIKERPLLGFGPMHFADIHNVVAAHPHQAILQWACEWGGPSTLLVMGLAAYGLLQTVKLIRRKAASSEPVDLLRICLLASLTGALAQSMVDGVIVMPYSQLWLALVVGWLMGIHEWSARPAPGGAVMRWGWIAVVMLAVGFLSYVVIRDFPHRGEREDQYAHDFGGNLQPRFWQQGVIATTP